MSKSRTEMKNDIGVFTDVNQPIIQKPAHETILDNQADSIYFKKHDYKSISIASGSYILDMSSPEDTFILTFSASATLNCQGLQDGETKYIIINKPSGATITFVSAAGATNVVIGPQQTLGGGNGSPITCKVTSQIEGTAKKYYIFPFANYLENSESQAALLKVATSSEFLTKNSRYASKPKDVRDYANSVGEATKADLLTVSNIGFTETDPGSYFTIVPNTYKCNVINRTMYLSMVIQTNASIPTNSWEVVGTFDSDLGLDQDYLNYKGGLQMDSVTNYESGAYLLLYESGQWVLYVKVGKVSNTWFLTATIVGEN